MKVIKTKLQDCFIIEPKVFGDQRGFFMETFQSKRYEELVNIKDNFVQDNYSRSSKGVLRGLHYQKNNPQGKLVRVVRGEVFDVAVDLRKDSLSYKQWESVILSEENKKQFWIPPGFAHGFLVLSEFADFEFLMENGIFLISIISCMTSSSSSSCTIKSNSEHPNLQRSKLLLGSNNGFFGFI